MGRWWVFGLVAAAALTASVAAPSLSRAEARMEATDRNGELMRAIFAEASARREAERDPMMKSWLSEIEGFYRVAGMQPLWVDETGLSPKGAAEREEIAEADRYGLDSSAFDLPDPRAILPDAAGLARAEVLMSLATVKYVWHARGGRVDPSKLSLWLDQTPRTFYASEILGPFVATADPAAVLRSHHPKNPQFEYLRQAYLKERGFVEPTAPAPLASGRIIQLREQHPDVAAIRARLGINNADGANTDVLDKRLLGAIREVMYDAGYARKNVIDDEVRREVSKISRQRPGSNRALIDKMLVNLERWRLVPNDMGKFHVWNNLPEFVTRVVKDGNVIHQEKIVIGTPATQTPIFSDSMSKVIFQPEWGVPESIKIRQLLPRLKSGDYGVLKRRNMQMRGADGKPMRGRINWAKVNIRDVSIVQGAGPDNPLGRLKFLFPNAHAVYMHDTPSKDLFETAVRTYSHGCIRVRNPDRFAEVILGETKGWTPADVKAQLADKRTFEVGLSDQVPVHNTYFTMSADAAGRVQSFGDVYGHDKRVLDALNGKSIAVIAAADPALAQQRENKLLEASGSLPSRPRPRPIRVAKVTPLPPLFGFAKPQPSYLKKGPAPGKSFFFN